MLGPHLCENSLQGPSKCFCTSLDYGLCLWASSQGFSSSDRPLRSCRSLNWNPIVSFDRFMLAADWDPALGKGSRLVCLAQSDLGKWLNYPDLHCWTNLKTRSLMMMRKNQTDCYMATLLETFLLDQISGNSSLLHDSRCSAQAYQYLLSKSYITCLISIFYKTLNVKWFKRTLKNMK